MTSMPLTFRSRLLVDMWVLAVHCCHPERSEGSRPWSGRDSSPLARNDTWVRRNALTLAVLRRAPRELLLVGVLLGGRLHHRLDDLVVAFVPVGAEAPLGAIPGLDACVRRAHVVGARGADGAHHAGEAQRVEFLLVEREVLETPANLLTRHHLALAEPLLRTAHAFDAEHRRHQAARVQHLPDFFAWSGALTLVVHELQHVLVHLRHPCAVLKRERVVALRSIDVLDVGLGAGPPHAIHLLARITGGD